MEFVNVSIYTADPKKDNEEIIILTSYRGRKNIFFLGAYVCFGEKT
jgi:hypothetical protein